MAEDPNAMEELVRIAGVKSVPVITCGNDVLVGYDPSRLQSIVNCSKQHSEVS